MLNKFDGCWSGWQLRVSVCQPIRNHRQFLAKDEGIDKCLQRINVLTYRVPDSCFVTNLGVLNSFFGAKNKHLGRTEGYRVNDNPTLLTDFRLPVIETR